MEYTFMIISAIVIITCFYFVISPFFVKEVVTEQINSTSKGNTIEAIYGAVNELEMDYLMKKISEDDFTEMKDKYQSVATELLNQERKTAPKGKQKNQHMEMIDEQLLKELEEVRRSKERRSE